MSNFDGVEAFVFAEDSNSLSIYDLVWNTLENTLVIAHERDMIKGIVMSYVCKTSKEIPGIKNIYVGAVARWMLWSSWIGK